MDGLDELIARHRQEDKDLQSKITQIKKSAGTNKKQKKDANRKVEQLEWEQKQRHEQERRELEGGDEDELTAEQLLAEMTLHSEKEEPAAAGSDPAVNDEDESSSRPRRNRRKEKLQKRKEEEEKIRAQAESEAAVQPDYQKMEQENLDSICQMNGLSQYSIRPDGHCLFASLSDQLKVRHHRDLSIQQLRTMAANHIRANRDQFAPFLFDEDTMTLRELDPYCEKLETTAMWGGEMEIMALAQELKVPVFIMFADRPLLKINEGADGEPLRVVYYKHSFALGGALQLSEKRGLVSSAQGFWQPKIDRASLWIVTNLIRSIIGTLEFTN